MCNSNECNGRVFDESIVLKDNAMLKVRPDLFNEWDFGKNDELGLDVYIISHGSGKKAWWICTKCESSYDMSIANKTRGLNCSYCRGLKVNSTNSLSALNPKIASQWHPTKNRESSPQSVTLNSNKKAWWLGNCGHSWEANICDRTLKNSNCPYCSNKKVLIGFNDIWTTNTELGGLLANVDDGYRYTSGSNKKVDWKCPDCQLVIKGKSVNDVNRQRLYCPNCSDGKSFPEKVMYHFLKQLNIDFEIERVFNWCKNKRYDFHLPKENIIIEVHGEQHYRNSFNGVRSKSLEEEQENDKIKKESALNNGIHTYIEIDCRKSELMFIKNNILSSDLYNIFNLHDVDWNKINSDSQKSFNVEILNLWNQGFTSKEICIVTKLHKSTIHRTLRNYSDLGKCAYGKILNQI